MADLYQTFLILPLPGRGTGGGLFLGHGRQQVGLVFVTEGIDDFIEMPLHDFLEFVESEVDAVVGDCLLYTSDAADE